MIAAVIVLYHPKAEEVFENIRSFSYAVDKVLIWRNSAETLAVPDDLKEKAILAGKGENDFIAKPLNAALEWCEHNGYGYLLTMDQDSRWENAGHFIERACALAEENVAIYAPYTIGQYARPEQDYDAESVITSGSLVNVRTARRLGGFREDYQIYWVDGEFCYWARKNGYRIRVLHDCALAQQFGRQTRTLFGFTTSNYSPFIYYLLIRNMFWMRREFPEGVSVKTVLYTLMYNIRGIVLGEKNKFKKIHSINKGIVHGLFSHFERRPAVL
jgi:rhamnosyltransferase